MKGLWIALETLAGLTLVLLLLFAVDCVKNPRPTNIPTTATPTCADKLDRPPMLCDRVTRDGTAECAICVPRGCRSSTGVFCVKAGCDDPHCVARSGEKMTLALHQ